jgi:hypothetical protein
MKQLFISSVVLLVSWYGVTQATSNLPAGGADSVSGFVNLLAPNGNQDSGPLYPRAFFSVSRTLKDGVGLVLAPRR